MGGGGGGGEGGGVGGNCEPISKNFLAEPVFKIRRHHTGGHEKAVLMEYSKYQYQSPYAI